jgi:4-amino-4-deoxy-L-arabinose transferase-like glycosyltransferase
VFAIAILIALLLTLWSVTALLFDSPFPALRAPAAIFYLIIVLAALILFHRSHLGLVVAFAGFALVAMWWFTLKPSNQRNWQADDAQQRQPQSTAITLRFTMFATVATSRRTTTHANGRPVPTTWPT